MIYKIFNGRSGKEIGTLEVEVAGILNVMTKDSDLRGIISSIEQEGGVFIPFRTTLQVDSVVDNLRFVSIHDMQFGNALSEYLPREGFYVELVEVPLGLPAETKVEFVNS